DFLPQGAPEVAWVRHPSRGVRVELAGRWVVAGLATHLQLLTPAVDGFVGDVLKVEHTRLELGQGCDVLDQDVTLSGLALGRDPGRDLRGVDVVDGDLDADLLAPPLRERGEPLVMAGYEVAPEQDREGTRQLGARFGEGLLRRLDLRVRGGRPLLSGASA